MQKNQQISWIKDIVKELIQKLSDEEIMEILKMLIDRDRDSK